MTPPAGRAAFAVPDDVRPFFLIGPPRSGTTLLGFLLGGGESVLSLSEPFLARSIFPDWKLQRFLSRLQRDAGLRRVLSPLRPGEPDFLRFLCEIARHNGLRRVAIKETYRQGASPPNWDNVAQLDRLMGGPWPRVALVRHPRDTVASTLGLARPLFARGLVWQRLKRGRPPLLRDLGLAAAEVTLRLRFPVLPDLSTAAEVTEWAANNWVGYVDWLRRCGMRPYRYEDLVTDPGRVLPAICAELQLPFHENMLDYRHPRRAFGGLGDPGVLERPPRAVDASALGRGGSLTPNQRDVVDAICAEKGRQLGYEL